MTPKSKKTLAATLLVVGALLIATAIFLVSSEGTVLVDEDSSRSSAQVGPISIESTYVVSTVKLSPAALVSGGVGFACLGFGIFLCFGRSTPPPLPPQN